MSRHHFAYLALCGLALAGCSGTNLDDLQQWTASQYADRKPKVEPLPEIRPYEAFTYTASNLSDPFDEKNLRPARPSGRSAGAGKGPDPNRRREPLEAYPLDSLRMVGTLVQDNKTWLVVRAPDGSVHHAQVGNYVGQNYGQIKSISEEKAQVSELIQDPNGNWIDRDASLSVSE